MDVLPVIDILHGLVVRGVAGERAEYRPIQSRLCVGSTPAVVAQALRTTYGVRKVYLADLDAIVHGTGNRDVWEGLARSGFRLTLDAGVSAPGDAEKLLETGVERAVIGLESCESPSQLRSLVKAVGCERLVFSLDLRNGRPLATAAWPTTAADIGALAIDTGIRAIILLDLAGVGVGRGIPTLELLSQLRKAHPVENGGEIEWITGGGVSGLADVREAQDAGVDELLIASALHDGRLTAKSLAPFLCG